MLDRDEWECQLCHDAISKNPMEWAALPGGTPTVDHIIPTSWGGPDAYWNLRASHSLCNEQRGNRVLPEDRDSLARNFVRELGGTFEERLAKADHVIEMWTKYRQPPNVQGLHKDDKRIVVGMKRKPRLLVKMPTVHVARPCLQPGCTQTEWLLNGKPWVWQLCEHHARQKYRGT